MSARLRTAAALSGLAALLAAAPAHGATASIFVQDSGSGDDPFDFSIQEDRPFVLRLLYNTDGADRDVVVKLAPGAPGNCARTPDQDPGRVLIAERVNGDSQRDVTVTEPESGQFHACAWIADPAHAEGWSFPDVEDLDVRAPPASVALTSTPPRRGLPLAIQGVAEGGTNRLLFAAFGRGSGPCSAGASASPLEQFFQGGFPFRTGGLEFVQIVHPPDPGAYVACGWVEEPGDAQAEASGALEIDVPSRRTRTLTGVVANVPRRGGRLRLWLRVTGRGVPYPVPSGEVLVEASTRPRSGYRRIGSAVNLADATLFDVCLRGHPFRNVLKADVPDRTDTHFVRVRYSPSSDFRRSRGFLSAPAGRRDIRGYDRERDDCGGKPRPAPEAD